MPLTLFTFKSMGIIMSSSLKGHWLWQYITGHIIKPIKIEVETDEKFVDQLKE